MCKDQMTNNKNRGVKTMELSWLSNVRQHSDHGFPMLSGYYDNFYCILG